jgi:hypothetical protein
MNKFTAMKQVSELDNKSISELISVDVVTLFMFERGLTQINYEIAHQLCEVLGSHLGQVFPALDDMLEKAEGMQTDEERQAFFMEGVNHLALKTAGIDPDLREWIAVVTLMSGVERRYRVSSQVRDELRVELASSMHTDGFLNFYADCQQVLVSKAAIDEVTFIANGSYAAFSSREKGTMVTMYREGGLRPDFVSVPGGGVTGEGRNPFGDLIDAAVEGTPIPSFIQLDDGVQERFVSVFGFDVIEMPMGVMFPQIYDSDHAEIPVEQVHEADPEARLKRMKAEGWA